jgi:hypothetical protein
VKRVTGRHEREKEITDHRQVEAERSRAQLAVATRPVLPLPHIRGTDKGTAEGQPKGKAGSQGVERGGASRASNARLQTCPEVCGGALNGHWKRGHKIQHEPAATDNGKCVEHTPKGSERSRDCDDRRGSSSHPESESESDQHCIDSEEECESDEEMECNLGHRR